MAIEIIEEGKVPMAHYLGTCDRCQCKVRCDREDAHSKINQKYYTGQSRGQYFDLEEEGFTIVCPMKNCLSHIYLYLSD